MAKVLVLSRDVTVGECPWLDADIKAGTQVWSYSGATYGCIGSGRSRSCFSASLTFRQ